MYTVHNNSDVTSGFRCKPICNDFDNYDCQAAVFANMILCGDIEFKSDCCESDHVKM